MKIAKKGLTLVLALIMCLGVLSVSAWADLLEMEDTVVLTVSNRPVNYTTYVNIPEEGTITGGGQGFNMETAWNVTLAPEYYDNAYPSGGAYVLHEGDRVEVLIHGNEFDGPPQIPGMGGADPVDYPSYTSYGSTIGVDAFSNARFSINELVYYTYSHVIGLTEEPEDDETKLYITALRAGNVDDFLFTTGESAIDGEYGALVSPSDSRTRIVVLPVVEEHQDVNATIRVGVTPEIDTSGMEDGAVKVAAEAINAGFVGGAECLAGAAANVAGDPDALAAAIGTDAANLRAAAKASLEEALNAALPDDAQITLVVEYYYDVQVTDASSEADSAFLSVNVTPRYNLIATTAEHPEYPNGIVLNGNQPNAAYAATGTSLSVPADTVTVITLPLPASLALDGEQQLRDTIFVQHDGQQFEAAPSKVAYSSPEHYFTTFTNPGGFPEFRLSATSATPTPPSPPSPSTPSTPPAEEIDEDEIPLSSFSDVDPDAWYADALRWAIGKGIMNGLPDGTFAPDSDTTRAMVVTMLWRLEGSPEYDGETVYGDVTVGAWYAAAVDWASDKAVVNGYSNQQFGPNDPVTREQLAAMLYRYAQFKGKDVSASADLSVFADAATVSPYAEAAMRWAVASEIVNGITAADGTRTLAPGSKASRAEVATMLMRFSEASAE